MSYAQQITSVVCFWIVLIILTISIYTYRANRLRSFQAVILLLGIAAAFLLMESIYIIMLILGQPIIYTMQVTRLQELTLLGFLPALPFFLDALIDMPPLLKQSNKVILYISAGLAGFILIAAFLIPDSFISIHHQDYPVLEEFLSGRGKGGILFAVRDIALAVIMIYSLIVLVFNRKLHRNHIAMKESVIGISLAILFAFFDIYKNFSNHYLVFPKISLPRLDVGLTFVSYFIFWGVLKHFFSLVSENQKLTVKLEEKQKELIHQANFDLKTDVFNRRLFIEDLEKVIKTGDPTGVIMLDLEGFHDMNEAFGSAIGDQLLIQVAERIRDHGRAEDRIYRMGNDEFALISSDISNKDYLSRYVEVLHSLLTQPIHIKDSDYYMNSSMGILYLPEDADNEDDALSYLFSALRSAKSQKNSTVFFNYALRKEQERKAIIAHQIRESLNHDEFYVVYQPIVDRSKKIRAVEALIRWKEDFFPDEFIPLAESAGLMNALGEYILNRIIRDLIQHPDLGIPVHINLSPEQFIEEDFASMLIARLQASGIRKEQVAFEITESFMIRNEKTTIANMEILHESGYRLALDDFGKGYSSLSYLNKLPIDTLKIDKAFVKELKEESQGRLISSVIELGKKFQFDLIAEGVEYDEQFKRLKDWGVGSFQGYLFSKPVLLNDLLQLLSDTTQD